MANIKATVSTSNSSVSAIVNPSAKVLPSRVNSIAPTVNPVTTGEMIHTGPAAISGTLTSNLTGNVIGDVTGNLTGNVTGNLIGTPAAPTAATGTNTTQIATTEFVQSAVQGEDTIAEMNDVTLTSLSDGELLVSSSGNFINQTLAEAGIAASSSLTTHEGLTNNPHSVTKTQVGLGNVEDKSSATIRGEIVDSDIPSTITRDSELSSHTALTNNPHSVTATQVSLGNVTNESKATMFTDPTFTGSVTGTLGTAAQANITSVGTLTSLTSSGQLKLTGVSASSGLEIQQGFFNGGGIRIKHAASADNEFGIAYEGNTASGEGEKNFKLELKKGGSVLSTIKFKPDGNTFISTGNFGVNKTSPAQALDVTGNIAASGSITGATLAGTLSTAAQPNITSTGYLTQLSLTDSAEVSFGSDWTLKTPGTSPNQTFEIYSEVNGETEFKIADTGDITAGNIAATLTTAAQPNITSVGTLTSLTVSGDVNVATTPSSGNHLTNKTYVDAQVAGVVNSAPEALNTLNELAAALGDDASFATTTATSIGEKLVIASNLSDLANVATARTNLGLGTAATTASSDYAPAAGSSSITSVGTLTSATISGDLTVNTTTLKVDSVNGRVGIGTATPTVPLDVVGNVKVTGTITSAASAPNLTLKDTDGTDQITAVFNSAGVSVIQSRNNTTNGIIDFRQNNGTTVTTPMRINSDGNVGIGTIAPSVALHVVGDLQVDDTDGAPTLTYDSSTNQLNAAGATFHINKSNGVDVGIGNDDLYVDMSTSRVGIGNTLPSNKLHVKDTSAGNAVRQIRIHNDSTSAGTGTGIAFTNSTSETYVSASIDSVRADSNASGTLVFSTRADSSASDDNATIARMTINDTGEVGIGKVATTGVELDVNGDIAASGNILSELTASGDNLILEQKANASNQETGILFKDHVASARDGTTTVGTAARIHTLRQTTTTAHDLIFSISSEAAASYTPIFRERMRVTGHTQGSPSVKVIGGIQSTTDLATENSFLGNGTIKSTAYEYADFPTSSSAKTTAAFDSSGTLVQDEKVIVVKVSGSRAKAMTTTPSSYLELIPAPGANKVLVIRELEIFIDRGSWSPMNGGEVRGWGNNLLIVIETPAKTNGGVGSDGFDYNTYATFQKKYLNHTINNTYVQNSAVDTIIVRDAPATQVRAYPNKPLLLKPQAANTYANLFTYNKTVDDDYYFRITYKIMDMTSDFTPNTSIT